MRFEDLAALTRNRPIARGEEPFPPPPWTWHGCEVFQIRVQLSEEAMALLPPALEPAPDRTGGFIIYSAPEGWVLAPHSAMLAWIEVEGYDSIGGSKGRFNVLAYWSGPAAPILNRIMNENTLSGIAWHQEADGIIRCGAGPSAGEDHIRFSMRSPQSERQGFGFTRYQMGRDQTGAINVHATPVSGDLWTSEPLDVQILAEPDNPLALMRPERLLGAWVTRNQSMTCGVTFNRPQHARPEATEPDQILALIERGAVLLDRNGVVTGLNDTARGFVGDGIVLRDGRLRASVPNDQPQLDALIRQPGAGASARPVMALQRPSGRKPLLVRSAPLRAGTGAGIVILIADPERQRGSDPAPALQLLGLTGSEARVAVLVGGGLSPREAAETLDRSEGAIRTSLQAIYGKLDIRRQSELAHLVRNLELGG